MDDLRAYREGKGISEDDAAEELGIAVDTYLWYEAHPGELSLEQARLFCKVLDCSFDFLLSLCVS